MGSCQVRNTTVHGKQVWLLSGPTLLSHKVGSCRGLEGKAERVPESRVSIAGMGKGREAVQAPKVLGGL